MDTTSYISDSQHIPLHRLYHDHNALITGHPITYISDMGRYVQNPRPQSFTNQIASN